MKNLSILILLLFASTLFAGEFKGNTSITIGGECPESMVSMLEDGSELCFLKDGPGYTPNAPRYRVHQCGVFRSSMQRK